MNTAGPSGTGSESITLLVLESASPAETQRLAAALAPLCRAGDMLLLAGDLGAGKTTFTQGFGRALGIDEPITSPTFTLVRSYPVGSTGEANPPGARVRTLVHADLYRLESLAEIDDLGLNELVEDGGVALVEWGDAAAGALGDGWLSLRFEILDEERRHITIETSGRGWSERHDALVHELRAAGHFAPADR